jgi:hypothetical protein
MASLAQTNPFFQAYRKYATQYPALEVIGGMLYDTVNYVSGTSVSLTFFTAGPRATLDLTNMEIPAQLPAPKAFLVRALRFHVKQTVRVEARTAAGNVTPGAIDNIAQLLNGGVLTFTIGAKPYAQFPLWMIPAGGGVSPLAAADGNTADPGKITDYASNGVPSPDNALILSQPLFLAPQINFNIVVTWPAALTLSGGNTNLCVVLDGDLHRPVQ